MTDAKLNHRLSAQDAAFLYFDREEAPMNIGSVGIFQGEIPYERFLNNLEAKILLSPRYRQRVNPPPFNINRPTWEFDPNFDIRNHVIHARLDPPGSENQLRDLACRLFQGRLNRDKPLWEIYLVHGLEGDRSATIAKVHHCLVDGVSGIELLMMVLDVSPDPPPPPVPNEPFEPPPIPDAATRFFDALFDRMTDTLRTTADAQKALLDALDNPAATRSLNRALEVALPYFLRPGQKAPFNQPFSGERLMAWSEYSFAELRAIRQAHGGTVNDVVLTVLGGALSRYYEAHGQATEGQVARVATPVNVRREDERGSLGNRISMILVEVPLDMRDPIQRLYAVRERTERLKRNHIADGIEQVANAIGNAPPALMSFLGGLPTPPNTVANIVCTNVPGPMIPLYSVGHQMEAHYPMVPIAWEMGVGCAVTSYNQRLYFGLMADANAAPDVGRLGDFLGQSYVELRSAAGVAPVDLRETTGVEAAEKPRAHPAAAASETLAADAG